MIDSLAPSGITYIKKHAGIKFDVPTRPREDEERDEDDNLGPQYQYYQSEKINGVLFDAIDEQKIWYQSIKGKAKTDEAIWSDLSTYIRKECKEKLGGLSWEHMKDEAIGIRRA